LAVASIELIGMTGDQRGSRVVADRPRGFADGQRLVDDVRRPGDAQQRTALGASGVGFDDDSGIGGAAGDQARRRQVQYRMQGVADADIECAGFTGQDDRSIAHSGVRPEECQNRAHRDDDGRQDAACDERERLCAHRIVQHADVSAQQRVLHPAHQKSITADLQPGCRLTSHDPPAPSLTALGGMAFHRFRFGS
jgi:hypothetical protein